MSRFEDDVHIEDFRSMHPDTWHDWWNIRAGTTYLNHGSFGPSPRPVIEERIRWLTEVESQPMDLLARRLGPLLDDVCAALGKFLGGHPDNFVLVPNATTAMNIVARNVALEPGDEVLLTDHEYGAVVRMWGQRCQEAGARTVIASLPRPLDNREQLVDALISRTTPRTRLIVVSHVTSATATILPIEEICRRARERGIAVCIDGPHALAMVPVRLEEIGCDYYAASCHKWLSAPFGTGFLYVRPRLKQGLKPVIWSWGRSLAGAPSSWKDEFHWSGTLDPSAFLAIPAAIRFLENVGLDSFRQQTHSLVREARLAVEALTGVPALVPDDPEWYGSMITLPLPQVPRDSAWPGKPHPLQDWLWEQHGIEVPVMEWHHRVHLRISCHLYNTSEQTARLVVALQEWLESKRAIGGTG